MSARDTALDELMKTLRRARRDTVGTALLRVHAFLRREARRRMPRGDRLRDLIDSEDLAQEALLRLIGAADDFRGTTWEEFWAFARTTLKRSLKDAARRGRSTKRDVARTEPLVDEIIEAPATGSIEIRRREIKRLVEALPKDLAAVVALRLEGHAYGTVAHRLGISVDAAKQRMTRAIRYLKG